MKLEIVDVIDNGTHASERVIFKVLDDTDLRRYILRDTTYVGDHTVSNKWLHAYRFLEQPVKKGDEVILYTKTGTNKIVSLTSHKKQYTYFWGLDGSVWNNDGDVAVLYEVSAWEFFTVKKKQHR